MTSCGPSRNMDAFNSYLDGVLTTELRIAEANHHWFNPPAAGEVNQEIKNFIDGIPSKELSRSLSRGRDLAYTGVACWTPTLS